MVWQKIQSQLIEGLFLGAGQIPRSSMEPASRTLVTGPQKTTKPPSACHCKGLLSSAERMPCSPSSRQ